VYVIDIRNGVHFKIQYKKETVLRRWKDLLTTCVFPVTDHGMCYWLQCILDLYPSHINIYEIIQLKMNDLQQLYVIKKSMVVSGVIPRTQIATNMKVMDEKIQRILDISDSL
jgi:hypothetical protein